MNQTPKISNSSSYLCLKHLIRPAKLKALQFFNSCSLNIFNEISEYNKASPAKVQIGLKRFSCFKKALEVCVDRFH